MTFNPVFKKYKRGSEVESTAELVERVLSKSSSVQWIEPSETPVDQYETYLRNMTSRRAKIQTYGTSPASDELIVWSRFSANELGQQTIVGEAKHILSPIGKRLMTNLPLNQISHRSRPYGVASFRLEVNELNRRITKAKENLPVLRTLALDGSASAEIASIKRDALLKRIKWDDKCWEKYVREHKDSSIVPGVKWASLMDDESIVDSSFKAAWTEMHKSAFQDHILTDQMWDSPFDLGLRARTGEQVQPGETDYVIDENRTRIVNFHMPASTLYSVVPDKTGMMDEIFTNVMDVFDINTQVMFPPVHGGEVYGAAAEALTHGEKMLIVLGDDLNVYQKGEQFAYDGVNWETQVGTLMGDHNRGTKTFFGGMWHLPSGVWDTTIDGSIATLSVFSQMEDEILAGTDISGVMERELMDEEVNFMLGLRYADDPMRPRLQGIKLTVDRKEQSFDLPRGKTRQLGNKYSEDEAQRWELAYYGTTLEGGSLLHFLEDIRPEDFRGGSEQITGAVMSDSA
jgi:hypothetical protein